jgi:IMP dehydrogenase/GMP reductase
MTFQPSYTFSEIGLIPRNKSTVESRDLVDTSIDFLGIKCSLPVLVAPMATVVGHEMACAIDSLEGVSFLPRTSDEYVDISFFEELLDSITSDRIIPSVPAKNGVRLAKTYQDMGARAVCIDVANGFSCYVERAVKEIQDSCSELKIITGNVGSVEGYEFLARLGVDAVRCGIGGGSVCSTSVATNVGIGQATLIRDIAKFRNTLEGNSWYPEKWPLIIADGGIKTSGHINIAIALGADCVMCGGMFGACREAAGLVVKYQGRLYKQMAGQASFAVKKSRHYIEGDDTILPLTGTVEELWAKLSDGIRSCCGYMDCLKIKDLKYLPDEYFSILSSGARVERTVHA